MRRMVLWGTDFCHLCDEAKAIVGRVSGMTGMPWIFKDIVDDNEALQAYRTMIPVVELGRTVLAWPFDERSLMAWVQGGEATAANSFESGGNQLQQHQS